MKIQGHSACSRKQSVHIENNVNHVRVSLYCSDGLLGNRMEMLFFKYRWFEKILDGFRKFSYTKRGWINNAIRYYVVNNDEWETAGSVFSNSSLCRIGYFFINQLAKNWQILPANNILPANKKKGPESTEKIS